MTGNPVPGKTVLLFVDDSSEVTLETLRHRFPPSRFDVAILHPEDVFLTDLKKADLVVVDYFLSDWQERDEVESVSRSPKDGLSVIGNLRSNLLPALGERSGFLPTEPVAFALWSGHLSQATLDLPEVVRPHVFSRENNIEWAFDRRELLAPPGAGQLSALADAISLVKSIWSKDESRAAAELNELLSLPTDVPWQPEAEADVLACRPPLHELGKRTHGMALIRWLLHRILPYPCFLMDESQVTARLRVDSIADSDVPAELAELEYRGALSTFLGRRWWRAGVEFWLYEKTNGRAGNSAIVRDLALRLGCTTHNDWVRPVQVLDGELRPKQTPSEIDHVIRIRPDDWPAYASAAYAEISDVLGDPELARLVDPLDKDLLPEKADH